MKHQPVGLNVVFKQFITLTLAIMLALGLSIFLVNNVDIITQLKGTSAEIGIDTNEDIPRTMEEAVELFSGIEQTPGILSDFKASENLHIPFSGFTKNVGQQNNADLKYYYVSKTSSIGFTTTGIHFKQSLNQVTDTDFSYDTAQNMMSFPKEEISNNKIVGFSIDFIDSNTVDPVALNLMYHKINYFIGSASVSNIPSSQEIWYYNLYDGIDLRYYMDSSNLKYEFIVHPEADVNDIKIHVSNDVLVNVLKDKIELHSTNYLDHLVLIDNDLQVYLEDQTPINAEFLDLGKNVYGFNIPNYDITSKLIIDPIWLGFSTYIGGSSDDSATDIVLDSENNVYVVGSTSSLDFPTIDSYQTNSETDDTTISDIFITKFNSTGNGIIFSTYIGGDGADYGMAITIDSENKIYIAGTTTSTNYPTLNPYDTTQEAQEGFITKISDNGDAIIYSTLLGGDGNDIIYDLKIDNQRNVFVTGVTSSYDYPTVNPYQTDQISNDVFVTKLNSTGNGLNFSTYIGGSAAEFGYGLVIDNLGNSYITGYTGSTDFPILNPYQTDQGIVDTFVLKLNSTGNGLVYSTYLGGDMIDIGQGIDLDSRGNIWITGFTYSDNFPTANTTQVYQGGIDAFLTKLNTTGNGLQFSSYLGGEGDDHGFDMILDQGENPIIVGQTKSPDFPSNNSYQSHQGDTDAFVTKYNSSGNQIEFSTFLGGESTDQGSAITIDKQSNIYIAGYSTSQEFPTVNSFNDINSGSNDGFITKISANKQSTYIGDANAYSIKVDNMGNIYVAGDTFSANFPTLNPYQIDQAGRDIVITKLNSTGNGIIFSTYLGGSSHEELGDMLIDDIGNIYAVGYTSSDNFPLLNPLKLTRTIVDGFVTILNSTGNGLIFSTFFGGSSSDDIWGIKIDKDKNIYISGNTDSNDFPTLNPYQLHQAYEDTFVTKLAPFGSDIIFSTYFGGSSTDVLRSIEIDQNEDIYITGYTFSSDLPITNSNFAYQDGEDIFVTKLNSSGNGIIYCTYISGESDDSVFDLAVDNSGNAYITGSTHSINYPTFNPLQTDKRGLNDVFITKLNSSGNGFIYSTYLGGSLNDEASGIIVDDIGNAYITGYTESSEFPTMHSYQIKQTGADVFYLKLNPNGSELLKSSLIGGTSSDKGYAITLDKIGNVYITGRTLSSDFPTINPYQNFSSGSGVFIFKYGFNYDIVPPSLELVSPQINSVQKSNTIIDIKFRDFETQIDNVIFNWGDNTNSTGTIYQPAGDGLHNLTVYVNDAANNWNTSSFTFITDDTRPSINSPTNSDLELGSTGNVIIWTLEDLYPSFYNVTLNDSEFVPSTMWSNGSILIDIDGLDIGTYSLIINAYDQVLNGNNDEVILKIVDTTKPEITHPSLSSFELGSLSNIITWTSIDLDPANYEIKLNGENYLDGNWVSGQEIRMNYDANDFGVLNFTVCIFDGSGNLNTDTVIITIVDTISPNIDSPFDHTYEIGSTENSISWNATDFKPNNYEVLLNGSDYSSGNWESGAQITISIDDLYFGTHNFTIIVFDQSGNLKTDHVTIIVVDTVQPTFNLEENRELNNEVLPGESMIIVIEDITLVKMIEYKWNDGDLQSIFSNTTDLRLQQQIQRSFFEIPVPDNLEGQARLHIIAYDEGGNQATFVFDVSILSNQGEDGFPIEVIYAGIGIGVIGISLVSIRWYRRKGFDQALDNLEDQFTTFEDTKVGKDD